MCFMYYDGARMSLLNYIFKEVPLFAIFTRNKFSTFPLSSCQYVSTIPEKIACYRLFKNGHFVKVSRKKMMDHQYKENGARKKYSNYNQTFQVSRILRETRAI